MGRKAAPRGIDVANMVIAYQSMIMDTRKMIEAHPEMKELNKLRESRLRHYENMLTRLQSSGAYARPKQIGSRLVLCVCDSCGYKVRTTAHWLALAIPRCPQEKMASPEGYADKFGGYTVGCKTGGEPMRVQMNERDKNQYAAQGAPAREAMITRDQKTIEQARKELEEFFGKDAGEWPTNGLKIIEKGK